MDATINRAPKHVSMEEIDDVILETMERDRIRFPSPTRVVQMAGYSSTSQYGAWKKKGFAPEVALWALRGLRDSCPKRGPDEDAERTELDTGELVDVLTTLASSEETNFALVRKVGQMIRETKDG